MALAALLALFSALPVQAHSAEDSSVVAQAPAAVEVIAGTVEELTIENRVRSTTRSYYGLQRDDGTTVLLTGPSAEALQDGARVALRGQHNGSHFAVHEVQPLSGADSATKPASAAQVEGTLAIIHADDFATGRSQYLYHVHDDAGGVTTLSIAVLPSELRGGMRVIVSGRRDAAASLHPQRITIVAEPAGANAVTVGVTLDGKSVPDAQRGPDLASNSALTIGRSDLFHVLTGAAPRDGTIVLSVPAGFRLYTFTFG